MRDEEHDVQVFTCRVRNLIVVQLVLYTLSSAETSGSRYFDYDMIFALKFNRNMGTNADIGRVRSEARHDF